MRRVGFFVFYGRKERRTGWSRRFVFIFRGVGWVVLRMFFGFF